MSESKLSQNNLSRGLVVSFEGIDGSGKTTSAKRLADSLIESSDAEVVFLPKRQDKFPSEYQTHHMGKIKEVLWDFHPDAPMQELGNPHWLALMLSWFTALDEIFVKPAIRDGKIIVLDNWYFKFLVRFQLKNILSLEELKTFFGVLTEPDLTFFLDVDPEIAADRKMSFSVPETGGMDGLIGATRENFIIYQSNIRRLYKQHAESGGWQSLSSNTMSISEVESCVRARIIEFSQLRSAGSEGS